MKILNTVQLQQADQQTIKKRRISSFELMESASQKVVEALMKDFGDSLFLIPIIIVCGKGNNGGDGLAISRLLLEKGADVQVFLVRSESYSDDNLINQKKLKNIRKFNLDETLELNSENAEGILIDCLFGNGLSSELSAEWQSVIEQINSFQGRVLAVDMPSGLMIKGVGGNNSLIIRAHKVYTFQVPKLALLLPDNSIFVGEFEILDIGLDQEFLSTLTSAYHYLEKEMIKTYLKPRAKYSHKGTYGHVCMIGGSLGKMGAVLMSSKAALRSGCGLVTAYIPRCGYHVLQVGFPEAMVLLDAGEEHLTDFNIQPNFTSYGVGIGMGQDEDSIRAFGLWLQGLEDDTKLVLDADALNILSENKNFLKHLPKGTILTPHPKELKRLIGSWEDDLEKIEKVRAFSAEHQVVVVIKGANTVIVSPEEEIYFNSTGNPGMATGGTGDILTGIISSLLAQGYSSLTATIIAVYVHGLAGDYAKKNLGETSLIAGDLITYLPLAFNELSIE